MRAAKLPESSFFKHSQPQVEGHKHPNVFHSAIHQRVVNKLVSDSLVARLQPGDTRQLVFENGRG